MSNDPYDQGRSGGQPPSGPEFNEWWRGNQDYLKGLQQGGSGDSGPLLGDDPNSEPQWPKPPQTFNTGENSEGGGNPSGFTVDSGCAVLLLTALALLVLPLALVAWIGLNPPSAHGFAASSAGAGLMHGILSR